MVRILFLHGAIESFAVRVLPGGLRSRFVVREMERADRLPKVLLELRTVVGEHEGEREREYRADDLEELGGCERCVRGRPEREAEAGIEVDECDDVPPRAVDVLLERVEGNTMAGIACRESVGLPLAFMSFDERDPAGARDALRRDPKTAEVNNEAANCPLFGAGQLLFSAECDEQRMQLLFAKVRMFVPHSLDLLDDGGVPQTFADDFRSSGAWVERLELASSRFELPLPFEQCPALHIVRVHCRC